MDFKEVTSRWRHRYYKVFPMEDLFGAIRYKLTAAERGVWYELRHLAGISEVPGTVCLDASHGYEHRNLATQLNVAIELIEVTVKKVIELGLCTEDEKGIHIPDWPRRQSEYDRQKKYRGHPEKSGPEKYDEQKYGDVFKR